MILDENASAADRVQRTHGLRTSHIPNEASIHRRSYCAPTRDILHGSGRILTRKATLQTKALAATQRLIAQRLLLS